MKALVLVGGYGTRLRPLTFTKPKPLVEFINIPMMEHQVAALSKVGVTEIILAVGYQSKFMSAFAQDMKDKYGVTVLMSHEKDPLGTFGAIKQAEDMLRSSDSQSSFFVCNADIICDYPFQEMIDYMQSHPSAEGVIALTKVLEP